MKILANSLITVFLSTSLTGYADTPKKDAEAAQPEVEARPAATTKQK